MNEIGFAFDSTLERLDFPFLIRPGVKIPIGEYACTEATVLTNTNFSRPMVAQVFYSFGDFFGGTRRDSTALWRSRRDRGCG